MVDRIFDTGDLQIYTNDAGGYTISFSSEDVVEGMQVKHCYICDGDELVVVLEPSVYAMDSFADQVVQEVEELEQLALDI